MDPAIQLYRLFEKSFAERLKIFWFFISWFMILCLYRIFLVWKNLLFVFQVRLIKVDKLEVLTAFNLENLVVGFSDIKRGHFWLDIFLLIKFWLVVNQKFQIRRLGMILLSKWKVRNLNVASHRSTNRLAIFFISTRDRLYRSWSEETEKFRCINNFYHFWIWMVLGCFIAHRFEWINFI